MFFFKSKTIVVRLSVFICLGILVSACSKPQVFLFARYLDDSEIRHLKEKLSKSGFEVTSNKHRFPSGTADSTLVYSINAEQQKIDAISEQLELLGYKNVKSGLYAMGGKQYFTGDSFGLYLFSKDNQMTLTQRADLVKGDVKFDARDIRLILCKRRFSF